MVTAGADRKLKVWDLRNYKEQQMYMLNKPVDCLDISQLGVLATGFGPHVHIWRDYITSKAQKPYMTHDLSTGGRIFDLHFTPFDDTLGIGHMKVRTRDWHVSLLLVYSARWHVSEFVTLQF